MFGDLPFGCLVLGILLICLFGGWFGGLCSGVWVSCLSICCCLAGGCDLVACLLAVVCLYLRVGWCVWAL